jgi:hypothetical protein
VAAGGSEPLLEANGIRIIGACPISPLSADVKVASTGGTVVAYGRSQSLGFVKATTTSTAKLGSSATGDRGEFNAFLSATGDTLDGSFMSFTSGGNCTFEASALAS